MECLVIIDMQKQYTASINLRLNKAIKKQIKKFKSASLPVIVVEYPYHDEGKTHKWINKLLDNYPKKIEVIKHDNDGSSYIKKKLDQEGFKVEDLQLNLVGVNHAICVQDTGYGLIEYGAKVRVIKEATNDYDHSKNVFAEQVHHSTYDLAE